MTEHRSSEIDVHHRSGSPDASFPELLQANQVKSMFGGVSDMWIWRRLKDGTLPTPIVISGRRFWRREEIQNLIDGRFAQR